MWIDLKADHGQYLTAENGGGNEGQVIARQPAGLAVANRFQPAGKGDWQSIEPVPVEGEPGFWGLKVETDQTDGPRFATAENQGKDGIVVFNRPALGGQESFKLWIHEDGRVSFEAKDAPGKFIKAYPDGHVGLEQPMFEDKPSSEPGGYEKFTPSAQFWIGADNGGTVQPPVGKVRWAGRGFTDDNGPFLGLVGTHMDAINLVGRVPDRFKDNVDFLAEFRTAQRILGMLGWGGDQRLDPTAPDYWERAVYAVRYAYEHGIRTEFTVYADLFAFPSLQTQRGREAHADRFISEFRDMAHMFQLIEGCNEPGNPDLWSHYGTPQELVDITRRIGDGLGVPWAPGALYGGRDASTAWWLPDGSIAPEAKTLIAGGQSVSMHFDRGVGAEGLWRPVRQPWEGKNTAENKPFLDNEPVGFQSSVTSYDDDNSHTAMRPDTRQLHRIAAAASWMAGAAFYCWHTEGGTGYSSERPIRNEPGLAEVCAARAALPADLPNFDKHNWHWASNPIETVAENGGTGCIYDRDMKGRGTLRTIGATNGGRVVEHAFCSPEGATFRARTGLDLSKLMYQDGAYREVDRISVSYGQTWQQEPMLDVLYVGRFK